jgi:hypothetical protein
MANAVAQALTAGSSVSASTSATTRYPMIWTGGHGHASSARAWNGPMNNMTYASRQASSGR